MKFTRSKKGYQFGDMLPLVITFIIIAIAVGLGAQVLSDINAQQPTTSSNRVNQTFTMTVGGVASISNFSITLNLSDAPVSSIEVYNNSKIFGGDGGVNYTAYPALGVVNITNGANNGLNTTTGFIVSYTYTINSSTVAGNVSNYGMQAQLTFAKWLPTIALVVVIAIILGILIVYLARRFA